jgi:hypothetical protein
MKLRVLAVDHARVLAGARLETGMEIVAGMAPLMTRRLATYMRAPQIYRHDGAISSRRPSEADLSRTLGRMGMHITGRP